ncbi:unnamed protein product [Peronospora belbahrii]|uniref:Acyltransferase n=1 Tax=Peronospora belbahrii TaxID=622444 RepID=A0ABN8D0P0_9STRA|nr:unnamed protein product [Peronospora belbahrii]
MLHNVACRRTCAWGYHKMRLELQTLSSRLLRGVLLRFIYGLLVIGSVFFMTSWLFTSFWLLYLVYHAVLNGIWTPLPLVVQINLTATAIYEGYHYITRDSQHTWPFMRRMTRSMFLHYPYFCLNAVVIEEHQEQDEDKEQEKKKKLRSVDGLNAQSAIDAVKENNVSLCFEPNKHALFTFHPHGILSCGFLVNGAHHMVFQRAACRWIAATNLFLYSIHA